FYPSIQNNTSACSLSLLPKSFILILSKIASSQRLHPNFWAKASAKLTQPDLRTKYFLEKFYTIF
ncbi:MAG: hypothetical protein IJ553_06115, partial [Alloprevotella sp.]|nr:hypothetical protein [Alloprevotella sp.]